MLAMYDLQNADPADLFWTVLTKKKKKERELQQGCISYHVLFFIKKFLA